MRLVLRIPFWWASASIGTPRSREIESSVSPARTVYDVPGASATESLTAAAASAIGATGAGGVAEAVAVAGTVVGVVGVVVAGTAALPDVGVDASAGAAAKASPAGTGA